MSANTLNPLPGFPGMEPVSRVDRMTRLLASNWWAVVTRGICGIIFGLIALFNPVVAIFSIALIIGIYMFVDGVFTLVAAWRAARADERWGWLSFEGIVNLLAAFVVFFWPLEATLAFVILLAAWSIITGVFMLAAAFQYKGEGRGWMVFSGLISIIFGVMLFSTPVTGAVVLTWWIGAYAVLFGIGMIALGVKLRRLHAV